MLNLFLKERKQLMPCEKNIKNGFTLIELMIVIVILSITALTAIPMLSSGASMQIRSAANMIAADLEYAKSMAISRDRTIKLCLTMTMKVIVSQIMLGLSFLIL